MWESWQWNIERIRDMGVYQSNRPLLFNSLDFFVFFLLLYAGYMFLYRRSNLRTLYLLAFSLFFYYKTSGWFLLLLLLVSLLNYVSAHLVFVSRGRSARLAFMWFGVLSSLGFLGYYKYSRWFLETLQALGVRGWSLPDIALPVGISFFTFQALSYTIDVYRGTLQPTSAGARNAGQWLRGFGDFAFYISFFPQLVAGPIVRAADFIPQIRQMPALDKERLGRGLFLIMGGLFKKAVLSDYISVNLADRVFDAPLMYSGLENLLGVYAYTAQIYCDFSGYSDMAIGLALLLGFYLPENFRTPYLATSIRDFWRRWHISLSTWLRDYLYVSLGGNRKGHFRTYVNLSVTMLLGGLWHGASWVFVLWGGLHGLALAFERYVTSGREDSEEQKSSPGFYLLLMLHVGIEVALALRYADGSLPAEAFLRYSTGNVAALAIWSLLALLSLAGKGQLRMAVQVVFTFHYVAFGWVFFRAGSTSAPLEVASQVLGQIAGAFHPELLAQVLRAYPMAIGLTFLAFLLHAVPMSWQSALEHRFAGSTPLLQSFVLALLIWVVVQASGTELAPFIYFQF